MITPMLVVPNFDLIEENCPRIYEAIVRISKGFTHGDCLEIDNNMSVIHKNGHHYLDNTNIEIIAGGFNQDTHELIFHGEDSMENYEDVLESIILESVHPRHEVSFTIIDAEGIPHDLGHVNTEPPQENTLFQSLQLEESEHAMAFDVPHDHEWLEGNYQFDNID